VVSRTRMMGAEPTARGWRVVTDKGDYEADLVVNAAGPWAGHVGDRLNAPVPLIPQLAGAASVKLAKPAPPLPFVMDYRPGSGTDGVYFRSERTDQLIAGLHTDEIISGAVSPDVALGPVTNEVIERMVNLLANRIHEADDLAIGRSWTGIYPMTPDHEPIVGLHPTADGIVCALGAGGSGIQLSPAMGRLAADVIGGRSGRRFAQQDDWAPARFTHPHSSIRAGEAS
jgi:sarcosine oxidase, subunit beta